MTGSLRDALAEIADHAPVADIPDDLWESAHRPRRRTVVAAAFAAAAVIASAAGLGIVLHHESPPPATPIPGPGAVPSHIYRIPDRLTGPLETDLAVGRSSVAYMTQAGIPVVVTARDGRYHLLGLPAFLGQDDAGGFSTLLGTGFALSPDGRSLAYAYAAGYDAAGTPSVTGVRVLDLETGGIRTVELPPQGQGTQVRLVTWSPDSRWLAWEGQVAGSWHSGAADFRDAARGRIAPGATTSQPLETRLGSEAGMAVDDRGVVVTVDGNRVAVSPRRGPERIRPVHPTPREVRSSEMAAHALAYDPTGQHVTIASTMPSARAYRLDTHRLTYQARALPALAGSGSWVLPLGWLSRSDGLVSVSEVRPVIGRSDSYTGATVEAGRIVLTRWKGGEPSSRVVARLDELMPDTVSVAVDLMTAAQPTHAFPPPRWPSSTPWSTIAGLSGLGALGLGWLGFVALARRRARR